MKVAKFEIFKDKEGKIRFRLKAPNGKIICQSEAYESLQACTDTIESMKEIVILAKIVDLTKRTEPHCCESH